MYASKSYKKYFWGQIDLFKKAIFCIGFVLAGVGKFDHIECNNS